MVPRGDKVLSLETITMAKGKRGSIAVAVASLEKMVESGVLGWNFQDDAKSKIELPLSDVYSGFAELPYIAQMTFARGTFEKVRDSYAGSESIADAIEVTESTIEYLKLGKWFKDRTPGERLGALFEAATRALTKAGKSAPDHDSFYAKYADESARASLKAMPEIKAELALIAKEKADAKAAEMVEAAKVGTSNLDTI